MKTDIELAIECAEKTWDGVYHVSKHKEGTWRVVLHYPLGPVKWIIESDDGKMIPVFKPGENAWDGS